MLITTRLVVVRRHDQEGVDAEPVRLLGQVHRVRGRIRPATRNDGCVAPHRFDRRPEEIEALVVGEVRALPGRPGDDEAVGAVFDEMPREPLKGIEVDGAVIAKRRDDRGQDVPEHLPILRVPHGAPRAHRKPSSSWLRHSPCRLV
jgi:hypothetical protein